MLGFDAEIVGIDVGSKLDLLDLQAMRFLSGQLLLALLLVDKLGVVHDTTYGWIGIRGDLDQVQPLGRRSLKRVFDGHNPQLLTVFVNQPHFDGIDVYIGTRVRFDGACSSRIVPIWCSWSARKKPDPIPNKKKTAAGLRSRPGSRMPVSLMLDPAGRMPAKCGSRTPPGMPETRRAITRFSRERLGVRRGAPLCFCLERWKFQAPAAFQKNPLRSLGTGNLVSFYTDLPAGSQAFILTNPDMSEIEFIPIHSFS